MKGWTSAWLRLRRSLFPAKDQTCCTRLPMTHGPCIVNATAEGPAAHFRVPVASSVPVASCKLGPTPQMTDPELAGERNAVTFTSPNPHVSSLVVFNLGCAMIGMIVRVTGFHSLFKLMGITGWTFN